MKYSYDMNILESMLTTLQDSPHMVPGDNVYGVNGFFNLYIYDIDRGYTDVDQSIQMIRTPSDVLNVDVDS